MARSFLDDFSEAYKGHHKIFCFHASDDGGSIPGRACIRFPGNRFDDMDDRPFGAACTFHSLQEKGGGGKQVGNSGESCCSSEAALGASKASSCFFQSRSSKRNERPCETLRRRLGSGQRAAPGRTDSRCGRINPSSAQCQAWTPCSTPSLKLPLSKYARNIIHAAASSASLHLMAWTVAGILIQAKTDLRASETCRPLCDRRAASFSQQREQRALAHVVRDLEEIRRFRRTGTCS